MGKDLRVGMGFGDVPGSGGWARIYRIGQGCGMGRDLKDRPGGGGLAGI